MYFSICGTSLTLLDLISLKPGHFAEGNLGKVVIEGEHRTVVTSQWQSKGTAASQSVAFYHSKKRFGDISMSLEMQCLKVTFKFSSFAVNLVKGDSKIHTSYVSLLWEKNRAEYRQVKPVPPSQNAQSKKFITTRGQTHFSFRFHSFILAALNLSSA